MISRAHLSQRATSPRHRHNYGVTIVIDHHRHHAVRQSSSPSHRVTSISIINPIVVNITVTTILCIIVNTTTIIPRPMDLHRGHSTATDAAAIARAPTLRLKNCLRVFAFKTARMGRHGENRKWSPRKIFFPHIEQIRSLFSCSCFREDISLTGMILICIIYYP